MWFSLSDQTAYFLWSIALGAATGMLYDLIRAVRIFLKAGKLHLMVSDILFFFICGILTSLFSLPFNKGDVRAFIVFGEAVGFLCFRLTIGQLFARFYSKLSKGITWILKKICELLKNFFDLLLKIAFRVVYNVNVVKDRVQKIRLKNKKTAKNVPKTEKNAAKKCRGKVRKKGRAVRNNSYRHVRKAVGIRRGENGKTKRNGYER